MFIGPFEHHSNELPWRESIADVVTIPEDADGHIDQARLGAELERYAERPLQDRLLLGRVSNVTGIVSDTDGIASLLHEHGALSLLGLRGLRAVRRHRDVRAGADGRPGLALQGRDLPLPAQVHRRARDPGRAGGAPRAAHQPGARTCPAAAP